jgi:predicted DNA-binding antitoxin AbrB/MazE fold protein
MPKIVEAVFENGVIRPLEAVELQEHQRVRVAITPLPGAVAETQGMIPGSPEVVEEVAESGEFLPF